MIDGTDFSQEQVDMITNSMKRVFRSTDCIKQNEEAKSQLESLKTMKDLVQTYCMIEHRHKVCMEIINKIERSMLSDNSEEVIPLKSIKEMYSEEVSQKDFSTEKYANHKYVKDINKIIKQSDEQDETMDEELAVTEQEKAITDPFTKAIMVDPVKNKVCGHNYEKTVIMEMIKKTTKCPIVGCSNRKPITKADLESDIELKTYIESLKS